MYEFKFNQPKILVNQLPWRIERKKKQSLHQSFFKAEVDQSGVLFTLLGQSLFSLISQDGNQGEKCSVNKCTTAVILEG